METPHLNATLIEHRALGDDLHILRVCGDGVTPEFVPGQFCNLGLGESPSVRPYTICSAPTQRFREFALVAIPAGELSAALANLRAGDRLFMERAPAGSFTLRDVPALAPLLLVATGTGIAPFVSMWRAGLLQGRAVHIIHGARTLAGLVYFGELSTCADLHYDPVLSRDAHWMGPRGRVQARLQDLDLDGARTHAMLCGNPAMIHDVRALLEARGFRKHRKRNPGNLYCEAYWQQDGINASS